MRKLQIFIILYFTFLLTLIPLQAVKAKGSDCLYVIKPYSCFTEAEADEAFYEIKETSVDNIVSVSDKYLSGVFNVRYGQHKFTMNISGANQNTQYTPQITGNVIGVLYTGGQRDDLIHEAVHVLEHIKIMDILLDKGMDYTTAQRYAANILSWQIRANTEYRFAHEAMAYWLQCRYTVPNFDFGPCKGWTRYQKNELIYEQSFPLSGRKHSDWVNYLVPWYQKQWEERYGKN